MRAMRLSTLHLMQKQKSIKHAKRHSRNVNEGLEAAMGKRSDVTILFHITKRPNVSVVRPLRVEEGEKRKQGISLLHYLLSSSCAASYTHRAHMHSPPRAPLAHSLRSLTGRSISQ